MSNRVKIITADDIFPLNVSGLVDITVIRGHQVYKIQKQCRLCKTTFNPSREYKWYCESCTQKYNLKE